MKNDDLISRQVAIDAIRASAKKYTGFMGMEMYTDDDAVEAIKGVPSTQPDWIPCSERLPRYGESVLTWDGVAYCVEKRIPCIRDEHGEPIYSDWWVSDDYDELNSEYYPNLRDGACIAWMPLPEPYQSNIEEKADEQEIH